MHTGGTWWVFKIHLKHYGLKNIEKHWITGQRNSTWLDWTGLDCWHLSGQSTDPDPKDHSIGIIPLVFLGQHRWITSCQSWHNDVMSVGSVSLSNSQLSNRKHEKALFQKWRIISWVNLELVQNHLSLCEVFNLVESYISFNTSERPKNKGTPKCDSFFSWNVFDTCYDNWTPRPLDTVA